MMCVVQVEAKCVVMTEVEVKLPVNLHESPFLPSDLIDAALLSVIVILGL